MRKANKLKVKKREDKGFLKMVAPISLYREAYFKSLSEAATFSQSGFFEPSCGVINSGESSIT
jgi:hypothetical protein